MMMKKLILNIGLIGLALVTAIALGTSSKDPNGLVQTQAASSSFTISRSSFTSGVLSAGTTDTWSTTSSDGTVISGGADLVSTASQTTMQVASSSYVRFFSSTQLSGAISSITISCSSIPAGYARIWIPYLSTSTQLGLANYTSAGTVQAQKYLSSSTTSVSWTITTSSNFRYFYLNTTATSYMYLDSISITYLPSLDSLTASDSKSSYYVDESFSKSTITATAHYTDLSTAVLLSSDYSTSIAEGYQFTVTDYNSSPFVVTLTYVSSGVTKTTTLSYVLIDRSLSSISLTTSGAQLTYETGVVYSSSGLVVTAHYADSTTQTVTSFTTSMDGLSFALSDIGSKEITVTYTSNSMTVTATYSVTVIKSSVWKHTFVSGNPASGSANGATFTASSLSFNLRMTPLVSAQTAPIVSSFNTDKGHSYGSVANSAGIVSLLSADFVSPTSGNAENAIYQVRVNASTDFGSSYNSGYATIAVYVGGVLGTCAATTLTSTPTDFIFDFSTPRVGKIEILLNNTVTSRHGGLFIKSIAVYADLLDAAATSVAQSSQASTFDTYVAGLATCSLSSSDISTLVYRYKSLSGATQAVLASNTVSKYDYIVRFYASSLNNVTSNGPTLVEASSTVSYSSLYLMLALLMTGFVAYGLYSAIAKRKRENKA